MNRIVNRRGRWVPRHESENFADIAMVRLCSVATQQALPVVPTLRYVQQVVEFGCQAMREIDNVQQVVLCNFPPKAGHARRVASPQDGPNGEQMLEASNLTVHRGEVLREHK